MICRAQTNRWRGRASCALFGVLVGACINPIVFDERSDTVTLPDADAPMEEDAASPEPEPEDAGAPPVMDAGAPDAMVDAGMPTPRDAGFDAGRDSGPPPPQDAGKPDAGCLGGRCDAGTPPGPCPVCGPNPVSIVSTNDAVICGNGAPEVCWFNPDGECTMQCPNTGSCSKDDPTACGPGRYCYFPNQDCGASSLGFCATIPQTCADVTVLACGCNGTTYKNPCVAALDGGIAVHKGPAADNCR